MQHLLSRESVDNRVGVVDQLVLITGGPSSDMRRTLDAATTARQDRLQLIVVGLSPWVNQVRTPSSFRSAVAHFFADLAWTCYTHFLIVVYSAHL